MFPANKFIRTEKTDMIVGTIRKATYIARSQPKKLDDETNHILINAFSLYQHGKCSIAKKEAYFLC